MAARSGGGGRWGGGLLGRCRAEAKEARSFGTKGVEKRLGGRQELYGVEHGKHSTGRIKGVGPYVLGRGVEEVSGVVEIVFGEECCVGGVHVCLSALSIGSCCQCLFVLARREVVEAQGVERSGQWAKYPGDRSGAR